MFKLPYRPQAWTALCWVIWHSWRPDRETCAPFILKTWCRMTYWWVLCWQSSDEILLGINIHGDMSLACVYRTAAGHGAQRSSVKSSSFWKGRLPSFASAAEFMMIFSEKWVKQHVDAQSCQFFFCSMSQAPVITCVSSCRPNISQWG